MARRTIPLIIAFVVGWLMILTKFIPSIESWGEDAAVWFDIVAAIAFALGGGNLLKIHTSKVKKQVKGWGFSLITVVCFLSVLFLGFSKLGAVPDSKNPFALQVSHPTNPVCWLIVGDTPHVAVLNDGEDMILGTGKGADILLGSEDDPNLVAGVAEEHCSITRRGDTYELEDLGSATGVFLDGERIAGPTVIRSWNKIRIGDVGDPVVVFREARTLLHQVPRPDGDVKIISVGSRPRSAHVHVVGDSLGDEFPIRLKFAEGIDIEVLERIPPEEEVDPPPEEEAPEEEETPEEEEEAAPVEEETGPKLAAGETLQLGTVQFTYRPSGKITGVYNEVEKTGFWYCYQYGFRPLQQAIFAMLAFYVASAAFRAFRAKNIEAIVLLLTAFLILLGRTYLGTLVTAWFPESMEGYTVPSLTVWIMQVINTAGNRAIMIGIALGVASTSLKVILGVDRSYLGGEE